MTDQPASSITLRESRPEFGKEIIRIDDEGFHYQGQFIADAGEAHRLMVEYLKQNTQLPPPEAPVDGEVAELVAWLRTNADYSLQKAATATFKRFHRIADLLERLVQPELREVER